MRVTLASLAALVILSAATAGAQAPRTERLTLRVEGMHCGSCAERIEDTVGELEGVVSADVDFEQTRATVVYDPADLPLAHHRGHRGRRVQRAP